MVHDVPRPDHRRQRQAASQALAEHDQVGLQPLVLETVQLAAARKAHFHFVDDHGNPVAPAALLDRRQESGRRHDEPAIRHQRLDEDRRHLLRRTGRRELIVEQRENFGRAEGGTIEIGIGQQHQSGARQGVRHRGVPADAHRSREVAVIRPDERNEARAAGRGLHHAHGAIIRVRARMPKPHPSFSAPRREPQQIFRQRHRILVGVGQQARSRHAGAGGVHRLPDGRMTVAQASGAERSRQVEKFPPSLLDQAISTPTDQAQRREAQARNIRDDPRVALAQCTAGHCLAIRARSRRGILTHSRRDIRADSRRHIRANSRRGIRACSRRRLPAHRLKLSRAISSSNSRVVRWRQYPRLLRSDQSCRSADRVTQASVGTVTRYPRSQASRTAESTH